MAGKYNTWLRRTLADRIRRNGGYKGYHCEGAPLEWVVQYYRGLEGAEQALVMLAETQFINQTDMHLQFPDIEEWMEEHFGDDTQSSRRYEYAQECLANDLRDDEGMRMWSPATAARYGFDYKGDGSERGFDMELCNYGRGGKHVCLTRFDGEQLSDYSCEDLADLVDPEVEKDFNYDPMFSNGWCRKLMGIMDELDETLTDENAERCGCYYEVDWLARKLGLFD